MIGVNLSGAFYCSRLALPRLRQAGGGYIINISSLAGKNPFAGWQRLQRLQIWHERL